MKLASVSAGFASVLAGVCSVPAHANFVYLTDAAITGSVRASAAVILTSPAVAAPVVTAAAPPMAAPFAETVEPPIAAVAASTADTAHVAHLIPAADLVSSAMPASIEHSAIADFDFDKDALLDGQVPEPATVGLLGAGLLLMFFAGSRRRCQAKQLRAR